MFRTLNIIVQYSRECLAIRVDRKLNSGKVIDAFLAELVTSKDYSSIVFDDPMSSLDHVYRARVAKRLAEEAQHRQVVIFTHDLGFLFEVNREAESIDVPIQFQHVKKRRKTSGFITGDLPLKAKTAPSLVAALRTELKDLKGLNRPGFAGDC